MSEIKVVPCPDHEFRYAITIDGQYETDKDGIWCAMLEAKAQEKAAELRREDAEKQQYAEDVAGSKRLVEKHQPVEQAAPPRPLDSEALDFLDEFYHAKRYLYVPNILYIRVGEILKKAGRL